MESFNTPGKKFREPGQAAEFDTEEVMQDTKERVATIVEQLREQIKRGEFGVVLGVDSSARVPALLLDRVIKSVHPAETRFVVGNRNLTEEEKAHQESELVEYFSSAQFRDNLGERKVLVVDDVVASGDSLDPICRALQQAHISYQIAALNMSQVMIQMENESGTSAAEQSNADLLVEKLGAPVTSGGSDIPLIYGKTQMSGVKKSSGIHATPLNTWADNMDELAKQYGGDVSAPRQDREVLSVTRARLDQIGKEIAQECGLDTNEGHQ